MRKLRTGTRVRAVRDLRPPIQDGAGRPFVVLAGEEGHIAGVGPDAAFGWYVVSFDDDRAMLMSVAPAPDAAVEEIP